MIREGKKQSRKRRNECSYFFCHNTRDLKSCGYCHEKFCVEHLSPKPPGLPNFKPKTHKERLLLEEWRKNGHPCVEWYKKYRVDLENERDKAYAAMDAMRKLGKRKEIWTSKFDSPFSTSPISKISMLIDKFRVHLRCDLTRLFKTFILFIISLLLTAFFYDSTETLNEVQILFLKVGSASLLLSTFFLLKSGLKLGRDIQNCIKFLSQGVKFVFLIILLLLIVNLYFNRTQYSETISRGIKNIEWNKFNPLVKIKFTTNATNQGPVSTGSQIRNGSNAPDLITTEISSNESATFIVELPSITNTSLLDFSQVSDEEIKQEFVSELNRIRKNKGLPEVELIDARSARDRLNYMLQKDVYSHYTLDGKIPPAFMKDRSRGMEENVCLSECYGSYCSFDYKEQVLSCLNSMIYEDSSSDWGHRDSLLDPCNNKVAVEFGESAGGRFYVVIHMFSDWVDWIEPPTYDGKYFVAKGRIKEKMGLNDVIIYYAPFENLTKFEAESRHSYDYGKAKVGVLKSYGVYYPDMTTIYADKWEIDSSTNTFDLRFKYYFNSPGQYTIILGANDKRSINWTPYSSIGVYRLGRCELLTYTYIKI